MNADFWKQFEGELIDGSFHLRQLLGYGGFGGVFLADHVIENRVAGPVAVKLILPDSEQLDQQLNDLIVGTNLQHNYLLNCRHAGSARSGPSKTKFLYLVMELSDGDLQARLKKASLSTPETADLIEQVSSALIFLHN